MKSYAELHKSAKRLEAAIKRYYKAGDKKMSRILGAQLQKVLKQKRALKK